MAIKNLQEANYLLTIDGQKIGEFSHKMLSDGLNLATNATTPQYKQALRVKELVEIRAKLEKDRIRSLATFEYGYYPNFPEGQPLDSIAKYFNWHLENTSAKRHYSYLKSQTEKYLFYKDVLAETLKELTLLDQMLQIANQPIIHKYDVVQLND